MTSNHKRSIIVYEFPRPSIRSFKLLSLMESAGFKVTYVVQAADAEQMRAQGFDVIEYTPVKAADFYSFVSKTSLALEQNASTDVRDKKRQGLLQDILQTPVPGSRPSWSDINVVNWHWLAVAEVMVQHPADIYWAADVNALPPAVWASRALEGSISVFDAQEIFTGLDYIAEAQLSSWEIVSRDFIPLSNLVITVSQEIAELLRQRYKANPTHVVHNKPMQLQDSESDLRSELGLDAQTPLAVHVGNVAHNRNVELGIKLLARIPELHLALQGAVKDEYREALQSQASELGVASRLHFVAPVESKFLPSFLRSADLSAIFYSAEISENLKYALPNKLFDALCAGIPTTASAETSAGRFITEHGLGVAYQDNDLDSLTAAVQEVLGDESYKNKAVALAPQMALEEESETLVEKVMEHLPAQSPSESIGYEPKIGRGGLNHKSVPAHLRRFLARATRLVARILQKIAYKLDGK